jgi:hypothetical protein
MQLPSLRLRLSNLLAVVVMLTMVATAGTLAARLRRGVADTMATAAVAWLATLDDAQRVLAEKPFEDAGRVGWHFVPKNDRKGVQLRDMTDAQQAAARRLLRSALSELGYEKSTTIMQLEEILRTHEGDRAVNVRDPLRYYFTIFGRPAEQGSWGLSVEGHHLSFNFTIRDGRLVDTTPQFMGANPAVVKATLPGLPAEGTRVLRDEEQLAFELVNSLDASLRAKAVVAEEAFKEIRAAGEPQPPNEPFAGIAHAELPPEPQSLLRRIVDTYCAAMPAEVAAERLELIESYAGGDDAVHHGWDAVHFAWAGGLEPGIGHAYRIEGPTFVIEFVNVQPDAEGNIANHIHCVWRDKTGDFDLPGA